jgi:hypothetical protein
MSESEALIHLLIITQLVGFLNSFLEDYLVGWTVLLLLGKIASTNLIKTVWLLPKIATKNLKNLLAQI